MKGKISVVMLILLALVQLPRPLRISEAREGARNQQERELSYQRAMETETKQDDCVLHLENLVYLWDGSMADDAAQLNSLRKLYNSIPEVCDGWQHNDPEAQRLLTELDAIVKSVPLQPPPPQ